MALEIFGFKQIIKNELGNWSISEELFNWIINNIPKRSTILELGSGYGTVFLSKHYNLYSVEHDIDWVGIDKNSNYIHAPLIDDWYDVEILKNKLPLKYDVLLIDGPIGETRVNILKHLDLFDFNCTVIIDDTNRELDNEMCEKISKIYNKEINKFKSENKEFSILI